MTKDEIIRMALEAGATSYTSRHFPNRPFHTFTPEQLKRFAALVAAAEREACAKECDVFSGSKDETPNTTAYGYARGAEYCAAAIRARGQ